MIILKILGIVALWFVAGIVINFLIYGVQEVKPDNDAGRFFHIVLNIATIIWLFNVIF